MVGLGDSHMFGWGVAQDETYLAVLERLLNEASRSEPRWEVLNFAAPGYNTGMEVATLEHRALAFDPDVIVVHFTGNDFWPPHFVQAARGVAPSQWYLVEILRGVFTPIDFDRAVAERREHRQRQRQPCEERRKRRERYGRQFAGRAKHEEAMERLAELAGARLIPVVTLTLGDGSDDRRFVRDVAEGLGLSFLDASPAFWEQLKEAGLEPTRENWFEFYGGGGLLGAGLEHHPEPVGHRAYARAIRAELEALELSAAAVE